MRRGVIGLVVLFSFSLFPAYSATPPKAGSVCSKQGITKTYKGKKYTCIKSGKRLVWSKGIVVKQAITTPSPSVSPIPTSTPTASPTPTMSPNPSPFPTTTPIPVLTESPSPNQIQLAEEAKIDTFTSSLDSYECKLVDVTVDKRIQLITSGFERFTYEQFTTPLRIRVIVVPVSFSDLKFSEQDQSRMTSELGKVKEFFNQNSYGQASVSFDFVPKDEWVLLPRSWKDYGLANGSLPDLFVKELLDSTSPDSRLSEYEIVYFETAKEYGFNLATGILRNSNDALQSSSGKLRNVLFGGGSSAADWKIIAHELGHNWLGFEDLYDMSTRTVPFEDWDLMSTSGVELLGWHRWSAKWLRDSQVYCLDKRGSSRVILSTLNAPKNKVLISVPIGVGKSLFIEFRKPSDYFSKEDSVFVYLVDTNKWHGSAPYSIIGALRIGQQKIVYEGVTIELQAKGGDWVAVKIN
jgi:M6 family metalloprotease-like protein